jgi:N-methylhydantoinase B
MRSLTCALSQIATLGVFSQAIPDRLPANSPGGNSIMNIRTTDSANRSVVASLGPVGGGAGGTPRHDGPDGSGGLSAFLKNTPIEINEAEVPIHFHRYGLAADSAGAGRYRGGLATEMAFEVFAPNTTVTARNRNRSVFASAGVLGGESGGLSHFRTLRNGTAIEHGNTDVIHCQPGDIVEVRGPGAGGYGLPVERDVQQVLQDVRCGFVSEQVARDSYGVALCDGEIDEGETARLRAEMPSSAAQHFDHGAARSAFEAIWTPERYRMLTAFLAAAPVSWRHFLKQQVFTAVAADSDVPMDVIFADLRARYSV